MSHRRISTRTLVLGISMAVGLSCTAVSAMAGTGAGQRTFTVAGTGASDKDFDANAFGMTGALGFFTTDQIQVGIRQSFGVSPVNKGKTNLDGSTRGFIDYHFMTGPIAPFVGANLGAVYGETTKESLALGFEVGNKFYVRDEVCIESQAEYQFLSTGTSDFDNRFDDGAVFYSLGIGYHF